MPLAIYCFSGWSSDSESEELDEDDFCPDGLFQSAGLKFFEVEADGSVSASDEDELVSDNLFPAVFPVAWDDSVLSNGKRMVIAETVVVSGGAFSLLDCTCPAGLS